MSMRTHTPKLGQHLLTSRDIARAVVAAGAVKRGDTVLEIGPGKGMLTRALLEGGARVVAVEKDPAMSAALRDTFPDEIKSGALEVYEADARDVFRENTSVYRSVFAALGTQYRIVANIPYYITGELLRFFLTARAQPESISLLVQKEVAERIARSEKESILSLSVKAYGEPHYVRKVVAGSFNPPPNVDSAILAISNISRKHFFELPETIFFALLHVGFGQKRKTLWGNVKRGFAISEDILEDAWKHVGIEKTARAEDIGLEPFLSLAKILAVHIPIEKLRTQ